ncbi:unnamed protein product [Rotaria sp. Silwood2]|nr:unnamed protein product [Rotaria sp. Silwood2]
MPMFYLFRDQLILTFEKFVLGTCTTLEKLPNEIILYLFTFIDMQNLYSAFWGLNSRLNNIFKFSKNRSLTVDENIDSLLMNFYASYVNQLIVQTSNTCDFGQFSNLYTLILFNSNPRHLEQIKPEVIPNLTYLSFLLGSRFVLPRQLVRDVFSNKFPSLRHVNLGRIHNSTCSSWATSPSLQSVSILYSTATSTLAILASCPNLHHFQVYTFYTNTKIFTTSAPLNHPLRRLTLWSNYTELTFNDIDNLLLHTPNIEYLYVQTVYRTSFIHLADGLINRLHYLSRFDCYIREMLTTDDRIGDLNSVHRMHPCFYRIHCIKQNDRYRIFATNH